MRVRDDSDARLASPGISLRGRVGTPTEITQVLPVGGSRSPATDTGRSAKHPMAAVALRSLLRDRFSLAVYVETRDMPVYHLVMARADGRLGPQLQASSVNCMVPMPPPVPGARGGPSDAVQQREEFGSCTMIGSAGRRVIRGYPMSEVARLLGNVADRVVFDRTGLSGTWNLELLYEPDQAPQPGVIPAPTDRPSLYAALPEQLGLRLQPTRGPVEVLVIDRIDRPTEN